MSVGCTRLSEGSTGHDLTVSASLSSDVELKPDESIVEPRRFGKQLSEAYDTTYHCVLTSTL
jgi:hypothetical protein